MTEPSWRLAVVNPGGRDEELEADVALRAPDKNLHPPVNYHGYAFCTGCGFYRDAQRVPAGVAAALVLLRRDLGRARSALEILRGRGIRCFLSFKESGLHQVANLLTRPGRWSGLGGLFQLASGALSSTHDLVPLYRAAGAKQVVFFPTPYPVDLPAWDFRVPATDRHGVFIGTREFDVSSRNHLAAVQLACAVARRHGRKVTLIDNRSCPAGLRRELGKTWPQLEWVRGPLPYPDYLGLLARHEVVFQLDRSAVPGQVAGDCCLARVLCIGGDGAVDQAVFCATCGCGRSLGELEQLLNQALASPPWREQLEQDAEQSALEAVSFGTAKARLCELLGDGGGAAAGLAPDAGVCG